MTPVESVQVPISSRITDSLAHLIAVQKLDTEIATHKFLQTDLPIQMRAIETSISMLGEDLKREEGGIAEMQKHLRKLESDLSFEEDQIKKTEAKMMAVKTNDEYRAALKEIEERKEGISKHEEEIIRYMDELEQAKGRLESFRKSCKEREGLHRTELNRLRGELEALPPKVEQLESQRKESLKTIPDEIMSQYQAILDHPESNRMAIVEVVKGICSGCNIDVLPQLINLIIRGERVYTCQSCRRILTYTAQPKTKT